MRGGVCPLRERRPSACHELPTCAGEFGLFEELQTVPQRITRVCREVWEHHAGISVTHTELPTFAVEFVNTKSS